MADYRRSAPRDPRYRDSPDRETEVIRDEIDDAGDFEDDDDSDEDEEEEDEGDVGKSLLDRERGAAGSGPGRAHP
jgi:hypothetical protein